MTPPLGGWRRRFFRHFPRVLAWETWVARHLSPRGEAAFALWLASGVVGVDTRQNLAHQVFAAMTGLLLVAWLLRYWPWRTRFTVQRHLPALAQRDQPLTYFWLLRHDRSQAEQSLSAQDELQGAWPTAVALQQALRPGDDMSHYPRWRELVRTAQGAIPDAMSLPTLSTGQITRVAATLTPRRRGELHFSAIYLRRPEPLGLFYRVTRQSLLQTLLVLPPIYPLPMPPLGLARQDRGQQHRAMQQGDEAEWRGVRDYRPGDPLGRIQWKRFAQRGVPVVAEYDTPAKRRYGIALDDGDEAAFEAGCAVAASLVAGRWFQDTQLRLFLGDVLHEGRGDGGDALGLLRQLAVVQPDETRPFGRLAQRLIAQGPQLNGLLLISSRWAATHDEVLQGLRRQGVVVRGLALAAGRVERVAHALVRQVDYRQFPQGLADALA